MKKLGLTAVLVSAAMFAAFAGGIENKSNMSTGYLYNPSKNTEAKRADAAFYNIAGTAWLKDGLYVEGGNQFVFKKYTNEFDKTDLNKINASLAAIPSDEMRFNLEDKEFSDTTTVWLYPDVDVVYKHGPWAVFANFGIYAGGGKLNFNDGTTPTAGLLAVSGIAKLSEASQLSSKAQEYVNQAQQFASQGKYAEAVEAGNIAKNFGDGAIQTLNAGYILFNAANNHKVEINSITYGETIGFAYNIGNVVSLAGGLRMVQGTQSMNLSSSYFSLLGNGGNDISYDAKAFGVGGTFGVHVRPIEKLDLTVQYQTTTVIEYEVENVEGKLAPQFGITNGKKFNTDLPAVFNFGAGYQVLDPLYVSLSFNWYLNKLANQNSVLGKTDYDDSWEATIGADYSLNEKWNFGLGTSYARQGIDDENNSSFSPVLNSWLISGGAEFKPVKDLTLCAAVMYVKYFDHDYNLGSLNTELSRKIFMASLGVTYRFGL